MHVIFETIFLFLQSAAIMDKVMEFMACDLPQDTNSHSVIKDSSHPRGMSLEKIPHTFLRKNPLNPKNPKNPKDIPKEK